MDFARTRHLLIHRFGRPVPTLPGVQIHYGERLPQDVARALWELDPYAPAEALHPICDELERLRQAPATFAHAKDLLLRQFPIRITHTQLRAYQATRVGMLGLQHALRRTVIERCPAPPLLMPGEHVAWPADLDATTRARIDAVLWARPREKGTALDRALDHLARRNGGQAGEAATHLAVFRLLAALPVTVGWSDVLRRASRVRRGDSPATRAA